MSEEIDIESEDSFMSQILNESNENNGLNGSPEESMPSGLNRLLSGPLRIPKLDPDLGYASQTPRTPFSSNNDRKRKNPTRRCLSEILDSSYNISPEVLSLYFDYRTNIWQINCLILQTDRSPTFFSFTHKSKERLSWGQSSSTELSPIFKKNVTSPENSENDSLMANTSMSSVCSPLFTSEMNPMKRPLTPKIRKSNSMVSSSIKRTIPIFRSFSANEAQIMQAVEMSCATPSLIGDCSKPYALPLIQGRHQDLKSISVDVLAQVLEGHYKDLIEECVVVDCRYPYEYNGGHIRGAKNIFSQEAILQEFIRNKKSTPTASRSDDKRHILIFHCEFSSERGPTLYGIIFG